MFGISGGSKKHKATSGGRFFQNRLKWKHRRRIKLTVKPYVEAHKKKRKR